MKDRSFRQCGVDSAGIKERKMSLETGGAALFNEFQSSRVHAVPEPSRFRAIVENMPEVGVTTCAENLGANLEERPVRFGPDIFHGNRRGKTWPARAGIELGV